jgi:hypothetical protein
MFLIGQSAPVAIWQEHKVIHTTMGLDIKEKACGNVAHFLLVFLHHVGPAGHIK